ncbi:MAG: PEP/pyruvate-binding domain-containing protein [Candidatus Wallbacteria bacterium]|nr:PEP/pyruvate-binding domain-containing protein [Candidatus Wallbacteria bacterium]
MDTHRFDEVIEKITADKDFLRWAVDNKGLAVMYLQYKKHGPESDPQEKKTLLESLSRLLISGNEHCIALIGSLFEYDDLLSIENQVIGKGKIGGKTTGMLLAFNSIKKYQEKLGCRISIPDSWSIGSGVFTDFLKRNGLERFEHVKFLKDSYEENFQEFLDALPITEFDPEVVEKVIELLEKTAGEPLILRSSSLLEDSFGTPFAGKYDSFFLANSFSPEENLNAFFSAVKLIYASVYNPNSLEYRRKKNLLNEYEAMAVLVQKVVGTRLTGPAGEQYFLPLFSGVGFSQNCYPWSDRVAQEDGVARLAVGLGTAVVEVQENERTFICDLSNFSKPVKDTDEFLRYSQKTVHVVDLNEHDFTRSVKLVPISCLPSLSGIPGITDVMEIADRQTGDLRPYTPGTESTGYPFVTFTGIREWGKIIRETLKTVEFHYSIRDTIQYLNDIKWDTVGSIIRILNSMDLDSADDPESLYLVDVYHFLKEDTILDFKPELVDGFFRDNRSAGKNLKDMLRLVTDSKKLLRSMDNFESFRKTVSEVQSRTILEGIKKIMSRNALDMEFAVSGSSFFILQCRPLIMYSASLQDKTIGTIPEERKFIDTHWPCPDARIEGISHVLFVDDTLYSELPENQKFALCAKIGDINSRLKNYMILMPGRVGSRCPELGVPVGYRDINNSRVLVEYPLEQHMPEFSYGSHFYLDLVGDGIYTFAVEKGNLFRKELIALRKKEEYYSGAVIVAEIPMNVYMSGIDRRIVCEIME